MSAAEVLAPSPELPPAADALPSPSVTPATAPLTFDVHALVDPDLWDQIPADVPELLALLPKADLYVQDEVDVRHHQP